MDLKVVQVRLVRSGHQQRWLRVAQEGPRGIRVMVWKQEEELQVQDFPMDLRERRHPVVGHQAASEPYPRLPAGEIDQVAERHLREPVA